MWSWYNYDGSADEMIQINQQNSNFQNSYKDGGFDILRDLPNKSLQTALLRPGKNEKTLLNRLKLLDDILNNSATNNDGREIY